MKNKISSKEWEAICKQCGLCCHHKINIAKNLAIINPNSPCKYLKDKKCTIYENRLNSDTECLTVEQCLPHPLALPKTCEYLKLYPNLKGADIPTKDQFKRIEKILNTHIQGNTAGPDGSHEIGKQKYKEAISEIKKILREKAKKVNTE